MFEQAVISKRSFARKGSCFENMPILFSHKFQILILSVRSYAFFGTGQKILRNRSLRENQNAQNANILTGSVCFDSRLMYCGFLSYIIFHYKFLWANSRSAILSLAQPMATILSKQYPDGNILSPCLNHRRNILLYIYKEIYISLSSFILNFLKYFKKV